MPLTNLIGRDREIAKIIALLENNQLVTLVGAGGVGKTQLSITGAHTVLSRFPDGVSFVELGGLAHSNQTSNGATEAHAVEPGGAQSDGNEMDLVASAVARKLDVKQKRCEEITETLANSISSRIMLVVLDNCEHLLESTSRMIQHLLDKCANLRVLATSRASLGLHDECVHRVPSLEFPQHSAGHHSNSDNDSANPPKEYSAVRLFIERAAAQGESRPLTAPEMLAIAEICRQLDGIPLAIEMAAAHVGALTIEDIRSRLLDRFNLLRGERNSVPRHQTLRALIDWSYELLGDAQKVLLRRLTVFAGGWTLEAAEYLSFRVGTESISELLDSLVNMSLAKCEERDGSGRYGLPESVRTYAARELVKSGEYKNVRDRHLAYYQPFAENAEPMLSGGDRELWLERLIGEYANLRGALDWCLSAGEPSDGLRLCAVLGTVWETMGYFSEGRAWCARALSNATRGAKTKERAKVLNVASFLACCQGDYDSSRAYSQDSLAITIEIGDQASIADSYNNLGNADRNLGLHSAALANYERASAIYREIEDRWGVSVHRYRQSGYLDFFCDGRACISSHLPRRRA